MDVTIAIFVSIGIFAVAMYFAVRWQLKVNESMRRVAAELGMSFGGGVESDASGFRGLMASLQPWRMEGRQGNVPIVCYQITRGSGKSSTRYTVVEASHASPLGLGLTVGRETIMSRLGTAVLNLQDITVGNERFDSAARVKGSDPERVKMLLSDTGVQESIVRLIEFAPLATVTDAAACFEKQGTITDSAVYREIFGYLVAVVEAIERSRR